MTQTEALKLAMDWYGSGNQDPDEFEKLILSIVAQPEFVLNGIDCSCGRKWRVVNNTLTASAQPEQEEIERAMLEVWQDVGDPRFPHIAQPEQEPWPNEPAGHMAGGVQPSKMTKSKAITAIYALFNAPHNADINLTGLNKVLDELMAQPEQEPVAWLIWLHGPAGHFDHKQFAELEFERRNKEYPDPDRKLLPLYTTPPQRTWVGLTDEEIWETPTLSEFARAIEAKLKEKNHG